MLHRRGRMLGSAMPLERWPGDLRALCLVQANLSSIVNNLGPEIREEAALATSSSLATPYCKHNTTCRLAPGLTSEAVPVSARRDGVVAKNDPARHCVCGVVALEREK